MSAAATPPRAEPAVFEVRLPVFEGPLQLLLHLVEAQQLDLLNVPLAEVADAYVAHLAAHPVEPRNLADFVATAAQLILLKSRRLLPEPTAPPIPDEEPGDEEELRRRLLEYRAIRDAAIRLGALDLVAPAFRREPRESDLPVASVAPLAPQLLASAFDRLMRTPEPAAPPPRIVAREVTIADQIAGLRAALAPTGRAVLQAILAACRSRTEVTVTVMALLELVRRRQVRVEQHEVFGPIVVEATSSVSAQ